MKYLIILLMLLTGCSSIHPIKIPDSLSHKDDTRKFESKDAEIKQLRTDISIYQWQRITDYENLQSWKRDPYYTIPLGACIVAGFTITPFAFICAGVIIWDSWLEG